MTLLLLLACVPKADHVALQDAYAELEAEHALVLIERDALKAENERLEAENQELKEALRPNPLPMASENPEALEARCVLLEDGRYTLDRDPSVLREGFGSLGNTVRAIPHKDHAGFIDGYRISAIRRHTLWDSCGLRNGDVLSSLNDMPLTSVSAVMEAFEAVEGAETLTLKLVRRATPMELVYVRPK